MRDSLLRYQLLFLERRYKDTLFCGVLYNLIFSEICARCYVERDREGKGKTKVTISFHLIRITSIRSHCVSSFSLLDSHSNGRWSSGKVSPGDSEEKWNTLCEHATPRCRNCWWLIRDWGTNPLRAGQDQTKPASIFHLLFSLIIHLHASVVK